MKTEGNIFSIQGLLFFALGMLIFIFLFKTAHDSVLWVYEAARMLWNEIS